MVVVAGTATVQEGRKPSAIAEVLLPPDLNGMHSACLLVTAGAEL